MGNVFLSYAEKDRSIFDRIVTLQYFRPEGATLIAAEPNKEPGTDLVGKVKSLLHECTTLIVVWSRNAACSPFVNFEIGYADAIGRRIISFKDTEIRREELPIFLLSSEYIPYDPNNLDQSIEALLNKIA